jgi:hypothetical protein
MERFFSDPRVVRILAQVIKSQNQPIENDNKTQKKLSNFGLIKQAQSLRSDLNRKGNEDSDYLH